MDQSKKYGILFVDDEESILKSLHRLFRKESFNVSTALGGEEGLKVLEMCDHKMAVIVSDQKMPKMNGAEFLEKAKAKCPNAIRILLTGYSDMEAIVDAVNKGEIHRYLTKPWNDVELIMHVKKAVEQFDLIEENKRLLHTIKKQNKQLFDFGKTMEKKIEERSLEIVEKNKALEFLNKELEMGFYNIIRAFASLLDLTHPDLKGHGKRVSALCVEMAKKLELPEEEITAIEIAGLLHDIGSITFSNDMIVRHLENKSNKSEIESYRKHPEEGQAIVSFINRLDEVGVLIRHHHENYDGKGYPDGLLEGDIPLGSRIISVADIYDRLTQVVKNQSRTIEAYLSERNITGDMMEEDELIQQAALSYIKQQSFKKYDPDMVKILIDVLKEKGVVLSREKKMPFNELKPGMVLTRSIYTANGRFILPHKTELSDDILSKINTILMNNEIHDVFFVMAKEA